MAFIHENDPLHAIWNGDRLTGKEASRISGIGYLKTLEHWDKNIPKILSQVKHIYLPLEDDQVYEGFGKENEMKIKAIRSLYPSAKFHSTQSILKDIMMVKHKEEQKLMRRAADITGQAFLRSLKILKPGMREFEVEAELTYEIIRHGGKHAFDPIIASGKDACTLHYIRNDKVIPKDALVLMDFGAEYANMASDISRTVPSSGRFTKDQRKVYDAVLRVLNEITSLMMPGMTLPALNKETGRCIERELLGLKLISKKNLRQQDAKKPLWKKYFMHGVSHHLGYDVHDLSDRNAIFRPGMVLTCEPALYIPEWKMGIRLENDILITRNNPENLTSHIPIEAEEIESLMHVKT
jgi:Xaa-Pro aminopeptidase